MPDQTDPVEQLPAQRPAVRRRDTIRAQRLDEALDHAGVRRRRRDIQPQPERRSEQIGFQRSARIARAQIANARQLHDPDLPARMLIMEDSEGKIFSSPPFSCSWFYKQENGGWENNIARESRSAGAARNLCAAFPGESETRRTSGGAAATTLL